MRSDESCYMIFLYLYSTVGMVSKPVQDPAPEFQIQQEDFPALPGAQSK